MTIFLSSISRTMIHVVDFSYPKASAIRMLSVRIAIPAARQFSAIPVLKPAMSLMETADERIKDAQPPTPPLKKEDKSMRASSFSPIPEEEYSAEDKEIIELVFAASDEWRREAEAKAAASSPNT